jgi:hypothetical protein
MGLSCPLLYQAAKKEKISPEKTLPITRRALYI